MSEERFRLEQKAGMVIFSIILMIILCGLVCSCEVFKHKESKKEDTVLVSKKDSGSVTENLDTSKIRTDWWREIIVRDTTINNFIQQPAYVIREGGTKTEQVYKFNTDSFYKSVVDSLSKKTEVKEEEKKTKVLGFWDIVGIAIGASLFVFLLTKIGKFKIVKI